MLEKAVFFSEYNNINITGDTSKSWNNTSLSPLTERDVPNFCKTHYSDIASLSAQNEQW